MYWATIPSADHCAAVHELLKGFISTGFRGLGLSSWVKDQFDGARGAADPLAVLLAAVSAAIGVLIGRGLGRFGIGMV